MGKKTVYRGQEYPSRVQAAWAKDLYLRGEAYEPEPERGRYIGYRPDFWLPGRRHWLEVKAGMDQLTPEVWSKARRLAATSRRDVQIVVGWPGEHAEFWVRAGALLVLVLVLGSIQAAPAYAQPTEQGKMAYVIESSGGLLLATNAGRWLVTLGGCDAPQPLTEVVLSADQQTLLLNSGEACTITGALFVDPTPCAVEAHGLCDVDLEPRG